MKCTSNEQKLLKVLLSQEMADSSNYHSEDDFFEFYSSELIMKDYDMSEDEIESGMLGGPLDGGFDSGYLFYNGLQITEENVKTIEPALGGTLELIVIQAKKETGFSEDTLLKWVVSSRDLFTFEDDTPNKNLYSDEIIRFFNLFKDLYSTLITKKTKLIIQYYYCSFASEIHPNIKTQAKKLESTINQLMPSASVRIEFLGAKELFEIAQQQPQTEVSLQLQQAPLNPGTNKDYIALVNLAEYYSFLLDSNNSLNKRLFESNVRDYQGKNSINREIYQSLEINSNEDFWWLNNGITILCNDVSQVTTTKLVINSPKIVNGLQTSNEIYYFFSNNPDHLDNERRNILVRIIVPVTEVSRDNIIIATNSQTNIPKATLRANDPIHVQIETYLRSKGLYYDRRKNYYRNQGFKSAEIVSLQFLSQCLISILLQQPNYARARPSTLTTKEETYKNLFNEKYDINTYYNAAKIGKIIQDYFKRSNHSRAEINDILFYVIYYSVAYAISHRHVTWQQLSSFNLAILDDSYLDKIVKEVMHEYKELGGNSTTAKGSDLIEQIMEKIEEA